MPTTLEFLNVPQRSTKPRDVGLTLTRDQGFSPAQVDDLMGAFGQFIDYAKIKQDRATLKQDRTQLKQDKQAGNQAAVKQDQEKVKQDRQQLAQDRSQAKADRAAQGASGTKQ